jgi:hypothetical protein
VPCICAPGGRADSANVGVSYGSGRVPQFYGGSISSLVLFALEDAFGCMEFLEKAQPGFGQANDGDASGATYLLGGVIEETHASALTASDSERKPHLRALRAAAVGSVVLPLGVTHLCRRHR